MTFTEWVEERKAFSSDDIADLKALVQNLKEGTTADKLEPETTAGSSFKSWAKYHPDLTSKEISAIQTEINALKTTPVTAAAVTTTPTTKPTEKEKEKTAEKKKEEKKEAKKEAEEVAEAKPAAVTAAKQPTVKPELTIERTRYPKWWKDEGTAKISLPGPTTQWVVSAKSDYSLYIALIVISVSGETDIIFNFGVFGPTGKMHFGGSDEPRAMVIAMGNSPAPCGSGSFTVTSDGEDVEVGGFATYYLWKEQK